MNNDIDFSDDDFKNALKPSGSEVAPSELHIEAVRLSVLSRTQQRLDSPTKVTRASLKPDTPSPSHRIIQTTGKLAVVAAIVALVFIVVRPFSSTAAADLRLALEATRRQHWIHAKTQIEYGDMLNEFESWCSPHDRIAAFRSEQGLHFINYRDSMQSSFSHRTNVIYQWRANQHLEELGRTFVLALLSSENLQATLPLHDVSEVERKDIRLSGKAQIQYSFNLKLKSNPAVHWATFVTVNRKDGQIVSWEEQHAGGMRVHTAFDYPISGPRDIYELGASESAEVIDRIASSDIVKLAEQFKEDVVNFGDYDALVIDRCLSVEGNQTGLPLFRRLRRDGQQFRVDLLTPLPENLEIPADADLAWWKAHAQEFESTTLAHCDGKTCIVYASDDSRLGIADEMIPLMDKQTTVPVSVMSSKKDSKTIPIWASIWPEFACRPLLVTSDPAVRFDVDPAGNNGPANSLRIRVLTPDSPFLKERASYWLSPENSYSVIKSSLRKSVFDLHSVVPLDRQTEFEFSNFERSSTGIVYAGTRVQSELGDSRRRLTTYILDFHQAE